MGKVIAITNQKGGVGKTTTAINVTAGLTKKGKRSLLIDLDSQGNASAACGFIIESDGHTLKDMLIKGDDVSSYIVKKDSIELIPSNNSLKDIEDRLIGDKTFGILKNHIEPLKETYKYIVIDCPPSINVFTKNALKSSDEIIIPVDVGYFSLIGLKQLLEEIEIIKEHVNPSLKICGVLGCKYDKRTNLSAQVMETLREGFPDRMFNTYIRMNVDIVRSQIAHKSIFDYSPRSTAAQDFFSLTEEILNG